MRAYIRRRHHSLVHVVCIRAAFPFLCALFALLNIAHAESDAYPWESRLNGDAIVLLGEVHDNPEQHRLRLEVLKRAFAAGWRPAIVMEQFDRERQSEIDQTRKERPFDAAYLVAKATASGNTASSWDWTFYRPYVELALQYDVPLVAANVSRSDAEKIVKRGYSAVFDPEVLHTLALEKAPATIVSAQTQEIDMGHCHALPKDLLPAMVRAQMARDAVMAATLSRFTSAGAVLLAGNGHVRRDIGVPAWLNASLLSKTLSVGFLERGSEPSKGLKYDDTVITEPASRNDPCESLRGRSAEK